MGKRAARHQGFVFGLSCYVFNSIFLFPGVSQKDANRIKRQTVKAYCKAARIKVPKELRN